MNGILEMTLGISKSQVKTEKAPNIRDSAVVLVLKTIKEGFRGI